MDLDRFLNLLAALFGAMGSLYVLKGIAALSPNLIERLSRTYIDFSTVQIDVLAAQKADGIVGVILIIIALLIAIVNVAAVPMGVQLFNRRIIAIVMAVVLVTVIYVTLTFVGRAIQRNQKLIVGRIITAQYLQEIFQSDHLRENEKNDLRVYARELLGMKVDDSESAKTLLHRVAHEVGMQVPETFNSDKTNEVRQR